MNTTNRVYDISTTAMLVVMLGVVVLVLAGIYAPSFTTRPVEIIGFRLVMAVGVIMAALFFHGWAFGRRTAEPLKPY